MKRFSVFVVFMIALLLVPSISSIIARADDQAPMTEPHIERIRTNCIEAQTTLTQLHASDALLRVNRGQLYESISTKLMTALNSRITVNRLDGSVLVAVTARYEQQLDDFRSKYQQYEESMSKALKIDCQKQPVAFYDSVTETRAKRKLVHDSTLALQKSVQDYKSAFEDFAKKVGEKS